MGFYVYRYLWRDGLMRARAMLCPVSDPVVYVGLQKAVRNAVGHATWRCIPLRKGYFTLCCIWEGNGRAKKRPYQVK